jgi:hypothetical protein
VISARVGGVDDDCTAPIEAVADLADYQGADQGQWRTLAGVIGSIRGFYHDL